MGRGLRPETRAVVREVKVAAGAEGHAALRGAVLGRQQDAYGALGSVGAVLGLGVRTGIVGLAAFTRRAARPSAADRSAAVATGITTTTAAAVASVPVTLGRAAVLGGQVRASTVSRAPTTTGDDQRGPVLEDDERPPATTDLKGSSVAAALPDQESQHVSLREREVPPYPGSSAANAIVVIACLRAPSLDGVGRCVGCGPLLNAGTEDDIAIELGVDVLRIAVGLRGAEVASIPRAVERDQ